MSKTALFIHHNTLPGQREAVRAVWEKHLRPAIAANSAHQAYFYCFDDNDPDSISVYQQYEDAAAQQDFVKGPFYKAYIDEVSPLLAGEPQIWTANVQWSKDTTPAA